MTSPEAAAGTAGADLTCTGCDGGILEPDQVRTAFWRGDELVVIEDVPALVCESCGERYFEDETAMKLDMLHGGKDAGHAPVRTLSVPVYSLAAPGAAAGKRGGK